MGLEPATEMNWIELNNTTELVILEPTDNPLSNDNDNIQLPSEKVSLLRNIKLSFIKCLTDCSCK